MAALRGLLIFAAALLAMPGHSEVLGSGASGAKSTILPRPASKPTYDSRMAQFNKLSLPRLSVLKGEIGSGWQCDSSQLDGNDGDWSSIRFSFSVEGSRLNVVLHAYPNQFDLEDNRLMSRVPRDWYVYDWDKTYQELRYDSSRRRIFIRSDMVLREGGSRFGIYECQEIPVY